MRSERLVLRVSGESTTAARVQDRRAEVVVVEVARAPAVDGDPGRAVIAAAGALKKPPRNAIVLLAPDLVTETIGARSDDAVFETVVASHRRLGRVQTVAGTERLKIRFLVSAAVIETIASGLDVLRLKPRVVMPEVALDSPAALDSTPDRRHPAVLVAQVSSERVSMTFVKGTELLYFSHADLRSSAASADSVAAAVQKGCADFHRRFAPMVVQRIDVATTDFVDGGAIDEAVHAALGIEVAPRQRNDEIRSDIAPLTDGESIAILNAVRYAPRWEMRSARFRRPTVTAAAR